jgi:cell division septum initiation protein DivIVA
MSEIEKLAAENAKLKAQVKALREALAPFADILEYPDEFHIAQAEWTIQTEDIVRANKVMADTE